MISRLTPGGWTEGRTDVEGQSPDCIHVFWRQHVEIFHKAQGDICSVVHRGQCTLESDRWGEVSPPAFDHDGADIVIEGQRINPKCRTSFSLYRDSDTAYQFH